MMPLNRFLFHGAKDVTLKQTFIFEVRELFELDEGKHFMFIHIINTCL
jgi:hypothetical protein